MPVEEIHSKDQPPRDTMEKWGGEIREAGACLGPWRLAHMDSNISRLGFILRVVFIQSNWKSGEKQPSFSGHSFDSNWVLLCKASVMRDHTSSATELQLLLLVGMVAAPCPLRLRGSNSFLQYWFPNVSTSLSVPMTCSYFYKQFLLLIFL